jgi:hypothetical protein
MSGDRTHTEEAECRGCRRSASIRLKRDAVESMLADYLRAHPDAHLVDDDTYDERLQICQACPALQFGGTTCRHCGCLVTVRAKLADKACPAIPPRWTAN